MANKYIISPQTKAFYEQLRKVQKRIEVHQTKARLETPYVGKGLSRDALIQLSARHCQDLAAAVSNIGAALRNFGASNSTTVEMSFVEGCSSTISDAVVRIAKIRDSLAGMKVDESLAEIQPVMIEWCDDILSEFVRFVNDFKQFIDVDGNVTTEQARVSLNFNAPFPKKAQELIARLTAAQSPATGRGGNGSVCFVATAVYRDNAAWQVCMLRDFRDSVLAQSGIGRVLIRVYARFGPSCAAFVGRHEHLRSGCRILFNLVARLMFANRNRRGQLVGQAPRA